MEDKRVTAEQILAEIGIDVERMAQKVADATRIATNIVTYAIFNSCE